MPIPSSDTSRINWPPSARPAMATRSPSAVNFTAFSTKASRANRIRSRSASTMPGASTLTAPRRWEVRVDAPGIVDADRERIRFATDGLVENAVKFTAEGDRVAIAGRADGGQLILEVSDDGMGIPTDQQGRIFERFARVDDDRARETGGTGLGLAITKAVAAAHGGSVSVSSEAGGGSTFAIRLPGFAPRVDVKSEPDPRAKVSS